MKEGRIVVVAFRETGEDSPRRHLAVHVVVDVVPVHGVEGAAGDGEAVGGFVVDVCFLRLVPLSAADTFVVQTYHDAWLD